MIQKQSTRSTLARAVNKLLGLTLMSLALSPQLAVALPPPEDTPEEVLRTEIVTEARSIMNGESLTAAEYAELQAALQAGPGTPVQLQSEIRHLVFLLRIRKLLKTLLPF